MVSLDSPAWFSDKLPPIPENISRANGFIRGATEWRLPFAPARAQAVRNLLCPRPESLTNPETIDLKKLIVKLSMRREFVIKTIYFSDKAGKLLI